MKKILLLVSVVFLGYTAKSQNFYAELNVGYGFGYPSSNLGMDTYTDLAGTGSYTKSLKGTLGGGLNITLAPGYMINKYIGVELGLNYFMGSKTLISSTTFSNENIYDKTTASSNQFRILPTVIFSTGGEKLYGFARTGLVIPVFGSTKGVRDASNVVLPLGTVKTDATTTTAGNVSLGFRGSIGIGYNITNLIGISLEVSHTSLMIKPKSRMIDSYTVAGQDFSGVMSTYDKETNYVDELNSSSNNTSYNSNASSDAPKDELAIKSNFSQLGFSLGIRFNF